MYLWEERWRSRLQCGSQEEVPWSRAGTGKDRAGRKRWAFQAWPPLKPTGSRKEWGGLSPGRRGAAVAEDTAPCLESWLHRPRRSPKRPEQQAATEMCPACWGQAIGTVREAWAFDMTYWRSQKGEIRFNKWWKQLKFREDVLNVYPGVYLKTFFFWY